MVEEVPVEEALARLEALLPGLAAYAATRHAATRARQAEIWARAVPDRPLPGRAPLPTDALMPDWLIDHARALGWQVEAQRTDDLDAARRPGEPTPGETVLVVVDSPLVCRRAPAERLAELVDAELLADDAVLVWSAQPRVRVVHHEGWVFDLRAPG